MKTENTITKAVALEMINSSFPSIWSREDVISLINKIEIKNTDNYFFNSEADVDSFAQWLLDLNEGFTNRNETENTFEFFVIEEHIKVVANYEVLKSVTYEFQKRHIIPQQSKCNVDLKQLKDSIINMINRLVDDSDFIDYESAEFEIGYRNQLTLQSVGFNIDMITDIVEDEFTNINQN